MALLTDREARDWMDRANEAEADVERLREALQKIADGRWNVGTYRVLTASAFAREVLDA